MSGKIFTQIPKIMADLGAIGKTSHNKQQGFYFRSIDAFYNELHQHLAVHGVFSVPRVLKVTREERTTNSGGRLLYTIAEIEYTFYADDGSSFVSVVIGEGMDSGDKSSNKAMAIAHKYALLQVFSIPTEEMKDPDFESHEVKPRVQGPAEFKSSPVVVQARAIAPVKPGPVRIALEKITIDEYQDLIKLIKASGWTNQEVVQYVSEKWKCSAISELAKEEFQSLWQTVKEMSFPDAMAMISKSR